MPVPVVWLATSERCFSMVLLVANNISPRNTMAAFAINRPAPVFFGVMDLVKRRKRFAIGMTERNHRFLVP
ncbi:hypothetical protein D3C80_1758150 [compost metagenome]